MKYQKFIFTAALLFTGSFSQATPPSGIYSVDEKGCVIMLDQFTARGEDPGNDINVYENEIVEFTKIPRPVTDIVKVFSNGKPILGLVGTPGENGSHIRILNILTNEIVKNINIYSKLYDYDLFKDGDNKYLLTSSFLDFNDKALFEADELQNASIARTSGYLDQDLTQRRISFNFTKPEKKRPWWRIWGKGKPDEASFVAVWNMDNKIVRKVLIDDRVESVDYLGRKDGETFVAAFSRRTQKVYIIVVESGVVESTVVPGEEVSLLSHVKPTVVKVRNHTIEIKRVAGNIEFRLDGESQPMSFINDRVLAPVKRLENIEYNLDEPTFREKWESRHQPK